MSEELNEIIKDDLEIDEIGINRSITFSIESLDKLGVKDINSFTAGIMDGMNNSDFNESNKDYIKGYKYGKTGKL